MRLRILVHPSARFYALAAGIVAICAALTRSRFFATNPDVAAWGITFDLTITIPLLYWFLVVRRGKARALTIAPVFLLGTLAATTLLPRGEQQFAMQLRTFAGPIAEVLLIGALIRRVMRFERRASSDPYERIAAAARTIAGDGRIAEVIASEITLLYYAFFCWRAKPDDDPRAMTFHQRNGWSTILAMIFVLIAAEGLALHLLLARWSPYAAWGWTILDLWAVMWLLGDYHALRLRRTSLDDDALHLRFGMRWSADIDRANIASVEEIREEGQWKQPGVMKIAILDEPRWLITLREPVIVRGLAGLRKEIRAIAMLPDDDAVVRQLLPH
ncbi:MAG TPA: hypothetical protein VF787_08855 [Thermoanaerobaculia bacterium]